jgi:hypothetical protein
MKRSRTTILGMLTVLCVALIVLGANGLITLDDGAITPSPVTPAPPTTVVHWWSNSTSSSNLPDAASYVIFKTPSGLTCAKNGTTGGIESSGSNSTTIIQGVIDGASLGATSKRIISLRGEFTLTWPIYLNNYTLLDLAGAKLIRGSHGIMMGARNGSHDMEVRGGIIDGQKATYTALNTDIVIGIGASGGESNISNVKISNVRVFDSKSSAIQLEGVHHFEISSCKVENSSYHGFIVTNNCSYGQVQSCQADMIGYYAFYVFGSQNIIVSDCIVREAFKGFVGEGVPTQYLARVMFDGCQVYGSDLCFHIENPTIGGISGVWVNDVQFVNCIGIAGPGGSSWVYLVNCAGASANSVSFTNCIADGSNVCLYGIWAEATNCSVSGCTVRNVKNTGILWTAELHVSYAVFGKITNNLVYNVSGPGGGGILVTNYASHGLVANNLVHDSIVGINIGGGATYIQVASNNVYNCTNRYAFGSAGIGLNITDNVGYVNHASGSAVILSGATYVIVTHGLQTTPARVIVSGSNNYTAGVWATSLATTTFRIYVATAVGANSTVYWMAEL